MPDTSEHSGGAMSGEPVPQISDPAAQDVPRAKHPKRAPLTLDEAERLPALNGPDVIMRLFQIGQTQFWRMNKQGAYDFLKVKPAVGPKCFSGELIVRYLRADPLYESTFGRRKRV